ncbi:alpha/beta hydrolase-fold protein [Rhodonellum sp.]|uniref:alpha/beta hydrolase-fold protein n=1 Tax=Rhodonellum sp. TaxID=2231180 RepID=UPI00272430A1|nr:alpha/beta hydrolase-fold protein [Rhodonellum sp.]MDO9553602.1 alpha/beta hydrolase-fold protein [Rhodonellum sp.]
MRYLIILISAFFIGAVQQGFAQVTISIANNLADGVKDGRLVLLFHHNEQVEPRFAVSDEVHTAQVFGMDFTDYDSGKPLVLDPKAFGYPVENLKDLPDGNYFIQAFIIKHETFAKSDGYTVLMPMDQGEGRQWNRTPGNVYSLPEKINWSGQKSISLEIDQIIPAIAPPKDTEFIKHIKIRSALLSEFWGRDMFLGANILLPKDFEKNKSDHYPLMVFHGHFPAEFSGFRTSPPDEGLENEYNARFGIYGYEKIQQQEAYDFYRNWTSDDFKRFIIIEIQHANPFYDDSYAVNSENLGPYGDAITHELIPYIEAQFRGIGEGWSRFLYGGSTGGWEALAVQVKYPKEYNGCFAACPDPIDFRAFTTVDIYQDQNAYTIQGPFRATDRVGKRNYLGHVSAMLKDMNHKELALGGPNSLSGDQWDIWQAVFSPVGDNGYPKPIWDKYTGEIDKEVADYWKEHYDLRYIMERDWDRLGEDLKGKIHLYCGDMDNYYLNNAVYLTEAFLEKTTDPYYAGEVLYGDRAEHCWNGAPDLPNYISRLRYNTLYLDKIAKRLLETAPENFNQQNWTFKK